MCSNAIITIPELDACQFITECELKKYIENPTMSVVSFLSLAVFFMTLNLWFL